MGAPWDAKPNNKWPVACSYRQIQVALRLFAQTALAAVDPSKADFWLADPASGAVCLAGQVRASCSRGRGGPDCFCTARSYAPHSRPESALGHE